MKKCELNSTQDDLHQLKEMNDKEFFLARRRKNPRDVEIEFQYPLESEQPKRKNQRAEEAPSQKEKPAPKQKSKRKEKPDVSDKQQLLTAADEHEHLMWLFVLGKKELWELPKEVQEKINEM